MKYLLFLFLGLGFNQLHAQSAEAGGWLGGTNSFNDLNNNSSFSTVRPAAGIIGKYNFNERIAAEAMFSYGRTFSSDQDFATTDFQINRNEASRTTAFDIALAGEFNFLPFNNSIFRKSYVFTPYLSAGIGLTFLNPEIYSRENNDWVSSTTILTEDDRKLNRNQITVPVAAGVKYQLTDRLVLAGEFGSRLLFTDYYDDVSTVYNAQSIENSLGTINEIGRQRGDRSRNDVYNLFGAQLTYLFRFNDCP